MKSLLVLDGDKAFEPNQSRWCLAAVGIGDWWQQPSVLLGVPAAIEFRMLILFRKDTTQARALAERLATSPTGVRLAVADLDVFGGRTRGWIHG